jgi:hypothetical protein
MLEWGYRPIAMDQSLKLREYGGKEFADKRPGEIQFKPHDIMRSYG